jgi:anti-sigma factor RsiW
VSCPGELLSALVDGELDHGGRERVLSHLLDCVPCRTEVDALRTLKTRLSWAGAETPLPADALAERLLGLVVPGVEPLPRVPVASRRPVSVRPAPRAAAAAGPRRDARRRRRAVGGAMVALGLTTAFIVGGPAGSRERQVQVDPGTDVFVADFVESTVEVPLTDPIDAGISSLVVGTSR